jgi:hypothetical protein
MKSSLHAKLKKEEVKMHVKITCILDTGLLV